MQNEDLSPGFEGIRFVTDANGNRVAVQLDLDKYGELWEDIQDGLIAESRRHEDVVPFEVVEAALIASGKLRK